MGTTISSPLRAVPRQPVASPSAASSDIPNYDDTKLTSVSAELKYRLRRWGLALGGWYERYRVDDSGTEGLSNYIPSQFFLNAANGSYRAVWGYVRASYTW